MQRETAGHPVAEGAVCKANFSGPGRVRRQRAGWLFVGISAAVAAALVTFHAAWYVRLVLFLPAAMAATSLLQVSRNTCVAHAAQGTFEHEDFTKTKQSDEDAAASRRVAATIYRDSVLIGAVAAAVAAASAFIG
jgi:hypothetical protein